MKTVIKYHKDGTKSEYVSNGGLDIDFRNYKVPNGHPEYNMQKASHYSALKECERRFGKKEWEKSVRFSYSELKNAWENGED